MSDSMWGKCSHNEDSEPNRIRSADSRTFPLPRGSSSSSARLFKGPILPLRFLVPLVAVATNLPFSSQLRGLPPATSDTPLTASHMGVIIHKKGQLYLGSYKVPEDCTPTLLPDEVNRQSKAAGVEH